MEDKQRGGKREGSGRKSTGRTKKPFTFYFAPNMTFKFGGEEKFREYIYDHVENYGEVNAAPLQIEAKLNEPVEAPPQRGSYFSQPEPKRKLIRTFEQYRQLKIECENEDDWNILSNEIRQSMLSQKQKMLLLN